MIMKMIPPSFHEGTSSLKRKAKRSTKAREEDLHIAAKDKGQLSARAPVDETDSL